MIDFCPRLARFKLVPFGLNSGIHHRTAPLMNFYGKRIGELTGVGPGRLKRAGPTENRQLFAEGEAR